MRATAWARDMRIATVVRPAPRVAEPGGTGLQCPAVTEEPRQPATLDEEMLEAEAPEVVQTQTDASRVERVERELEMGFEALAHVGAAVSVFGSARTPVDHPEYEQARVVGCVLGR